MHNPYPAVEEVQAALAGVGYYADRALATTVFLALALERPLFLEGEPGVGKTELAKALAAALGRPLVRLQCYEGIDRQSALYDWNYPAQMLHIRLAERLAGAGSEAWRREVETELFSEAFLIRRPLLAAIEPPGPAPVLLIDEIDRSDEEFEAFLLELLAEFQVTIPELGTRRARERPAVVLTSNRTREVHDALKRRCLYHWIPYPDFAREYRIVRGRAGGLAPGLAEAVVAFVQRLRQEPLTKRPGVAETVDWAQGLGALGVRQLEPAVVEETLGALVKLYDDLEWLTRPGEGQGTPLARVLAESGG